MNRDELMRKLYIGLGEEYQLVQLKEELSELIQAVCKYERFMLKAKQFDDLEGDLYKIMDNIIEESADVIITVGGLMQHFNIEDKVKEAMDRKVFRTQSRAKKYISYIP